MLPMLPTIESVRPADIWTKLFLESTSEPFKKVVKESCVIGQNRGDKGEHQYVQRGKRGKLLAESGRNRKARHDDGKLPSGDDGKSDIGRPSLLIPGQPGGDQTGDDIAKDSHQDGRCG